MRIKKTSEAVPKASHTVNEYSESTKNTYSCDYINKTNKYSSTETVIGTYNNKPVYRKVVDTTQSITGGGAYMDQGNYTISSGVTNIDTLLRFDGYMYEGTNIRNANQSSYGSVNERLVALINYSTGVITGRTAYTLSREVFILEYTKTTD